MKKNQILKLCMGVLFLIWFKNSGHAQIISTIAGNGLPGYSGNGGLAVDAKNAGPAGTVIDGHGNIYFADPNNNVISKIDLNGVITRFAGTGIAGFTGNGGQAINANLLNPSSLTCDNLGNIYFADSAESRLRKINSAGIITIVAGNGHQGYSGDGGPATAASFNFIFGATPDNKGNVYVADFQNSVVRKINSSGIVSTIAGKGTTGFSGDGGPAINAEFNSPMLVGIDQTGNIYVPDLRNRRIRKINSSGIISTIAGNGVFGYSGDGGPATSAEIGTVYQITVDAAGNIYLADVGFSVIRKIDCTGTITTVAGTGMPAFSGDNGPATSAALNFPINLNMDALGNLYISDQMNNRVRKLTENPVTVNRAPGSPSKASICVGSQASFNFNIQGAKTYQWQILSGNQWSNLTDDSLFMGSVGNQLMIANAPVSLNGSRYRCILTTSCNYFLSEEDTLLVNGRPLSISINTNTDSVCLGGKIIFSANAGNDTAGLQYKWTINGSDAGNNRSIFTDSFLSDHDIINCIITDPGNCAGSLAESNSIQIYVSQQTAPGLHISSSGNETCSGESVKFHAETINAGDAPAFQWQVNGNNVGSNQPEFNDNFLKDGDVVSCIVTGNSGCMLPIESSNTITMIVHESPRVYAGSDTIILPGKSIQINPIVAGNISAINWSPAGGLSNQQLLNPVASPVGTTTYTLTVTDNNGCKGSGKLQVGVFYRFVMPNAFTPNGDGENDEFRIPPRIPVKINSFSIYNRWGNLIFKSTDAGRGWDGLYNGIKQNAGSYIWIIDYYNPATAQITRVSGSVMLIR